MAELSLWEHVVLYVYKAHLDEKAQITHTSFLFTGMCMSD